MITTYLADIKVRGEWLQASVEEGLTGGTLFAVMYKGHRVCRYYQNDGEENLAHSFAAYLESLP